MKTEKRTLAGIFEARDGKTLVGYAAVWDSPAQITEGSRTFTEIIRRGAFRGATESKADILASFNHNPDRVLGRTSAGTLRLHEDERGLRFEVDLPEHASDVREMIARGDVRGASFTFRAKKGGEVWDGNLRTLTDVFLYELGPVTLPAYGATTVGLRSKIDLKKMRLQLEEKI